MGLLLKLALTVVLVLALVSGLDKLAHRTHGHHLLQEHFRQLRCL